MLDVPQYLTSTRDTETKAAWYWHKNRLKDRWTRIEGSRNEPIKIQMSDF
jgi:hypothetical protein